MAGVSGCVLTSEPPRNSRFIGDYSDFERADFKEETWVYRHPTTRVIDYDRFMIAPVTVYDNPRKKIRDLDRPLYDDLAEDLRLKLTKLVSQHYKLVQEPGPGVLALKYSVVDIKPNVWVKDKDGNRVLRTNTKAKGSKFELDCHDSLSEEKIFVISTLYPGRPYAAYEDPALIPNIEKAYEEWARYLNTLIQKAKTANAEAAKEDRSAFRPSTSSYLVDSSDPGILIYRHPRLRVTSYKKFFLAIPRLEGWKELSPEGKKELGLKLRDESYGIIDDPTLLINHPGPGILTVRTKIKENGDLFRFELECIDPNQGDLVLGMIRTIQSKDVFDAYGKWNDALLERWNDAKEDAQ